MDSNGLSATIAGSQIAQAADHLVDIFSLGQIWTVAMRRVAVLVLIKKSLDRDNLGFDARQHVHDFLHIGTPAKLPAPTNAFERPLLLI